MQCWGWAPTSPPPPNSPEETQGKKACNGGKTKRISASCASVPVLDNLPEHQCPCLIIYLSAYASVPVQPPTSARGAWAPMNQCLCLSAYASVPMQCALAYTIAYCPWAYWPCGPELACVYACMYFCIPQPCTLAWALSFSLSLALLLPLSLPLSLSLIYII